MSQKKTISVVVVATNDRSDQQSRQLTEIYGGPATAFQISSKGMNAASLVLSSVLAKEIKKHPHTRPHIIVFLPVDGETYRHIIKLGNIVDCVFLSQQELKRNFHREISEKTVAVVFEPMGNPNLPFLDIEWFVKRCKNYYPLAVTICDNTYTHGGILKPFQWGIDISVANIIKDSNRSFGEVAFSERYLKSNPEIERRVRNWIRTWKRGHHESWIADSLSERIIQSETAQSVAEFLSGDPAVAKTIYPTLPSYPEPWKEYALKYLEKVDGKQVFGNVVPFYLKFQDRETVSNFLSHLSEFGIKHKEDTFGEAVTNANPCFFSSHREMKVQDRLRCGIDESLIRLYVGLEPLEIIIAALDSSLRKTFK